MSTALALQPIQRLPDSARSFVSAASWFLESKTEPRKVQEMAQRRSEDFLRMNAGLLRDFGVRGQVGTSQGALGLWFELHDAVLSAPKGQVQWGQYVTQHIARGQWLQVPCRCPDLLPDTKLGSALHWTVLRHQGALRSQLGRHEVVHQLLQKCESMLSLLRSFAPVRPAPGWQPQAGSAMADVFRKGLEAIYWTVDERGLGGTSDLAGLPWRMDMAPFFEAWVEAIAEHAARQKGATLTTGRRQETMVRLHWQPAK